MIKDDMDFASRATVMELGRAFHVIADDLLGVCERGYLKSINPDATLSSWAYSKMDAVCLTGLVGNHPFIADGPIRTSELYYVDLEAGLARTFSRWYRLTTPASSNAIGGS